MNLMADLSTLISLPPVRRVAQCFLLLVFTLWALGCQGDFTYEDAGTDDDDDSADDDDDDNDTGDDDDDDTSGDDDDDDFDTDEIPDGWELAWHDEFNSSAVDEDKWSFDTGTGFDGGWGNQELQFYTSRGYNVKVEDGKLKIIARREDFGGRQYTSARLTTRETFATTYGRIEARIKLPQGQGIWPAFWMIGAEYQQDPTVWPGCGEIDIMECKGNDPGRIYGSMHGPGYSGGNCFSRNYALPGNDTFAERFSVFAIEWEADRVMWYVDGTKYSTFTENNISAQGNWVFDHDFYININVSVGGNYVGDPDSSTEFPQVMEVDYIRVLKRL